MSDGGDLFPEFVSRKKTFRCTHLYSNSEGRRGGTGLGNGHISSWLLVLMLEKPPPGRSFVIMRIPTHSRRWQDLNYKLSNFYPFNLQLDHLPPTHPWHR